jgi:hypothetical protein
MTITKRSGGKRSGGKRSGGKRSGCKRSGGKRSGGKRSRASRKNKYFDIEKLMFWLSKEEKEKRKEKRKDESFHNQNKQNRYAFLAGFLTGNNTYKKIVDEYTNNLLKEWDAKWNAIADNPITEKFLENVKSNGIKYISLLIKNWNESNYSFDTDSKDFLKQNPSIDKVLFNEFNTMFKDIINNDSFKTNKENFKKALNQSGLDGESYTNTLMNNICNYYSTIYE